MIDSYVDIDTIASTGSYSVKRTVRIKDQVEFARKELCKPTEEEVARFQNEVRILSKLNHPSIIRVVDQQLIELPYYVITPLYKSDLRSWIRDKDDLIKSEHLDRQRIFSHILDAIEYAHEQGIIHRDIKPENVLLNSPEDVVVIDFNISLNRGVHPLRQTQTGQVLGTAHYLAPEQLRDAKCADERADIFSLGVVLYELYGGKIGSSKLGTDGLPSLIKRVVLRCVEEDPNKRYQSAADLKKAWRLAYDANSKQSEISEIELAMLNLEGANSTGFHPSRLLNLLENYVEDVDLLNRFFMESDVELLRKLAEFDSHRFDDLLKVWTEFFVSQNWPFDYTDHISKRCVALWSHLEHSGSKALIVCSLVIVGNKHNRYLVWRNAAQLISHTWREADVQALREFLFVMDENQLTSMHEYVEKLSVKSELKMIIFREAKTQPLTSIA